MDKIVVGVDGSELSLRALHWALDEARARQAAVVVVHAWHVAVYGAMGFYEPAFDPATQEAGAKELVDGMLTSTDTSGVPTIHTVLVQGDAGLAITDQAADASLVVVGSRGHGAVAGLLLGSVSKYVLRHAACPIVVIPAREG